MESSPQEASSALAEIARRQGRVVERVLVPGWYWWLVGAGMIAVGFAADTKSAAVIVPVALVYALAVAALTAWMIVGRGNAQVSRRLLGNAAPLLIVLFDWLVIGVSLGTAFALRAGGFGHPGAAGTIVGAVLLVAGGPILMRRLRQIMLANRG